MRVTHHTRPSTPQPTGASAPAVSSSHVAPTALRALRQDAGQPTPIPSAAGFAPAGTPARGSVTLLDLRLGKVPERDGVAFCENALKDMAARTARGEKCRVVLDLDNTLFDTRARTLSIGHAFDEAHGTRHFAGKRPEDMAGDGESTAAALKMSFEDSQKFAALWATEFWHGENLKNDLPMESVMAWVHKAAAVGAEVVYLTGRNTTLFDASLEQLQRAGLPGARAENLFCKPVGSRTALYKAQQLDAWQQQGIHIGFFITEGRKDTGAIQAAAPQTPCVLLASPFESPKDPVLPGTPVLPSVF
jgi:hypothetical protein